MEFTPSIVLAVDDELQILNSIERLLKRDEGISMLKTQSPIEALEIIRSKEISLIISDNMMPEMKGIELLSKVRVESPETVRVLMTAYADLETALEAINTDGVFKFIVKPWDNSVLKDVIDEGVKRHRLIKSLQMADEGTMLSLAQTIELKDPYTKGHCDRVATYALMIADLYNISEEVKTRIKHGAWLHDCGKIGIPESILNFNGPLSDSEMDIVKKHPQLGIDVIKHVKVSDEVKNIILYHHERVDGKGYPTGISKEDIPFEARIVAVADVYDSLSTKRPYRKALDKDKVKEIVLSMTGTNLDPEIVEKFFVLIESNDQIKTDQDKATNE